MKAVKANKCPTLCQRMLVTVGLEYWTKMNFMSTAGSGDAGSRGELVTMVQVI